MDSSKTYVIGDIHGCLPELKQLLDQLNYSDSDRLIFVGDLINKGPDSRGVLELVDSLGAESIKGNKELGFLAAMRDERTPTPNDLQTKSELGSDLDYWLDWMNELPLFIETDEFLVVHAGLVPGEHPSESSPEVITRIRTWDGTGSDLDNESDPPWYEFYKKEKLVIFGHWAALGLLVRRNAICLDSGCVYGGELTALELPTRSLHQVQAKQVYSSID